MGLEHEGSSEAVREQLSTLAEGYFSDQKKGDRAVARVGFDELMDAYAEAVRSGNFSDRVRFTIHRGGETVEQDEQSVTEYLKGALKKYDHYAGDQSPLPEEKESYQQRADTVKTMLEFIEQLSGSN